jgi:hypothetical protein
VSAFTPGPWRAVCSNLGSSVVADQQHGVRTIACTKRPSMNRNHASDARLIAAAPTQHEEMQRYLPLLERAEADPELWERLTAGTGIATLSGYRAALAKATQP